MRIALGAGAGLLLASAVATPARAQHVADARASTFSIGAGLALPQGDALDEANAGWIVTGGLTLRPTALPFALRLEALYARFGYDEVTVTEPEGSFTAELTTGIFAGMANAVVGPAAGASAVRPYVIGGVGMYYVNADADFDIDLGEGGASFGVSESETAFGVNGGAGIDFALGRLRSFVEARYHFVLTDFADPETGEGGDQRTSFIPIVIGLRF